MTVQDKRVGLWCADNVIRFTDSTVLRGVAAPNRLLASIMSGGKLTVYVTNPELLDPFMAHVVHSLPHDEHNANLSWDAIISKRGNSSISPCGLTVRTRHVFSTYRIFCERIAV